MDLKISDLDYELFEAAYQIFQQAERHMRKCDATVMGFLNRLATEKGLDPEKYRFSVATRSFEAKPESTETKE